MGTTRSKGSFSLMNLLTSKTPSPKLRVQRKPLLCWEMLRQQLARRNVCKIDSSDTPVWKLTR